MACRVAEGHACRCVGAKDYRKWHKQNYYCVASRRDISMELSTDGAEYALQLGGKFKVKVGQLYHHLNACPYNYDYWVATRSCDDGDVLGRSASSNHPSDHGGNTLPASGYHVFVGGLPVPCEQRAFRAFMNKYGFVCKIKHGRGFALVEFQDSQIGDTCCRHRFARFNQRLWNSRKRRIA